MPSWGGSAGRFPPASAPTRHADWLSGKPRRSKPASRWKCTFAPTRELFDRGVGVDVIRRRLAEVGMVVEASPVVMPDASIAFNFTVEAASDADLRQFSRTTRWSSNDWRRTAKAAGGNHPDRAR